MKVRIGTRGSRLAMAQARWLTREIARRNPGHELVLETIKTRGDRLADRPFSEVGMRGIFTRELDEALVDGRIDAAIHSLKDLPSDLVPGTRLAAVTASLDPRDALVSGQGKKLGELGEGNVIGTASLRRQALIRSLCAGAEVRLLRGNLDTRLRKLDEGHYDAIVVAAAGLRRLGSAGRVTEYLDPTEFVPAPGQGRLGVNGRAGDAEVGWILSKVDDPHARRMTEIERIVMDRLEGGCLVPLGLYGEDLAGRVRLHGFLALPDGSRAVRGTVEGSPERGPDLARELTEKLLDGGGREILRSLRSGSAG